MPTKEFVIYLLPVSERNLNLRLSFSEANCTPLCPKCYSNAQRLISSFACKTGGNLQATEKPFRKETTEKAKTATRLKRKTAKHN